MKVPRPTDADRARFRMLVPDEADVEVTPMFGNLGAFVRGHMFTGLVGADVGVKLEEPSRSELAGMAAVLPAKAPKARKAVKP